MNDIAIDAFFDATHLNDIIIETFFDAIRNNDIETVQKLLIEGIDVNNITNEFGDTPLICAAKFGDVKILELLLNATADVNYVPRDGYRALLAACTMGNVEQIHLLIEHGADIKAVTKHNNNALHCCFLVFCNDLNLIKYLVEHGVDPNHTNKDGLTPLELAIKHKIPYHIVNFLKSITLSPKVSKAPKV